MADKEYIGGVAVVAVKDTVSDAPGLTNSCKAATDTSNVAESHDKVAGESVSAISAHRSSTKEGAQPPLLTVEATATPEPYVLPPALSPIKDEGTYIASRETTFNQTPVLPPIRPTVQILGEPSYFTPETQTLPLGAGVPMVNVHPPTPQHSTLTQAGNSPKPASREPTVGPTAEEFEDGKNCVICFVC